jgi:hypothetical protein
MPSSREDSGVAPSGKPFLLIIILRGADICFALLLSYHYDGRVGITSIGHH